MSSINNNNFQESISSWALIWIAMTSTTRASTCAVSWKTTSTGKPSKRSRITSELLGLRRAAISTISLKWSTITWNGRPSTSPIRSPTLAESNEFCQLSLALFHLLIVTHITGKYFYRSLYRFEQRPLICTTPFCSTPTPCARFCSQVEIHTTGQPSWSGSAAALIWVQWGT